LMNILQSFLDSLPYSFVILDGGFATTLESFGLKLHSRLWSAYCLESDPLEVYRAHRIMLGFFSFSFSSLIFLILDHGAQIISTAT